MGKVIIHTDGACRGNPGIGGWGAVLTTGSHQRELYGADPDTTNNKMELTAAIMALEALTRHCQVVVVTDSQYLRKGITEWIERWKAQGWMNRSKKPVKNQGLWIRLDEAVSRHCVEWEWVKGHAGHPGNEHADSLANRAIDELQRKHL
jgi:ribonuclease HI